MRDVPGSNERRKRDEAPDSSPIVSVREDGRDPDLKPGQMVGEYRIEGRIGEGTFGVVYRATHPVIGKAAAVKVLHRTFSASPEIVRRFVEEARAANRIRHRGIIDIFGFGALPDGRQYCIMELLEGQTLDHYICNRGTLSFEEALPILRNIARAIDAAHAVGIIHRDLKPDNVFLVRDEDQTLKPKILDFGVAKLLGEPAGPASTIAGTAVGTPDYMSPEQCRGHEVDRSTDVYAFGVMVFEILCGKMPFQGNTAMDTMLMHVSENPPLPSSVNPNLPDTVDGPILQMLAKDPRQRPASLTLALEDVAEAAGFSWRIDGRSTPPMISSGTHVSGNFGATTDKNLAEQSPMMSQARKARVALGLFLLALGLGGATVVLVGMTRDKHSAESESNAPMTAVSMPADHARGLRPAGSVSGTGATNADGVTPDATGKDSATVGHKPAPALSVKPKVIMRKLKSKELPDDPY